ncbi:MAG: DMT family transporter [Phreatobacter sp.]|uniref:DMT family transporter n=1 Tax=Phreatobacter sp. TaxID=1966341 RepID=UPI001A48764C|nr:DMT family transporter [Phreatobacter sp.]MBL8569333.1 DMT family transporter [Phreatobacter sp.]
MTLPPTKLAALASRGPMPFVVAALGIFLLSAMDALIKGVATAHPTAQIVFMRYACGLPWALLFFAIARPPAPSAEMVRAHVLRGVLVVITAFLFFYALATLPLAEAITLTFLSPLFLAVLAAIILKEPIPPAVLIAIVVGFVGMTVIVAGKVGGGQFDLVRVLGIGAAVSSALAYAANLVLLRKRAQTDPFGLIILFQNLFPLIIIAPFAWLVWETPELRSWLIFLGIGGFGLAGHLCMAWAFRHANAGPLGVLEYTALIWSAGLGYLFFAEIPAWTTWAGAALIVAACLAVIRK